MPQWSARKATALGLAVLAALILTFSSAPLYAAGDEECLGCHTDSGITPFTKGRDAKALLVGKDALKDSVHRELSCTDCHEMDNKAKPHGEGGPKPNLKCDSCHETEAKQHAADAHGLALSKNTGLGAPTCATCHGKHDIKAVNDPSSPTSRQKQPELCGRCHGEETLNGDTHIAKRKLIERYTSSVHWQALKDGKPAASCADCHGAHNVNPSSNPDSATTRINLLKTCAKCHAEAVAGYAKGSHGRTLLRGNNDVPICTTCHGDHDMISLKVRENGKRDFAATQVCMWCHGNARLMSRYALDTSPVDSYLKDFHGLTQRSSLGASASCADCHDAHRSLPSSHPESRMNMSNRGTTCGKCHGKSSASFIMSFTHKSFAKSDEHRFRLANIVKWVYIVLIALSLGGMILHNAIIWLFFARKKLRYQAHHGKLQRLSPFELRWHGLLFLSFTLLAISGFALSYANSAAFSWLYKIGLSESTRAIIHRVSAVILIFDMLVWMVYTAVSRHGRRFWTEMLPRFKDLTDFFATMSYYLGRRAEKPRYDVFNYAEKFEYLALLWGMAVMALTGFVLWFSKLLPPDAPSWMFEVARVIHFYEAVLAVSAIIVWHFYHVIFHPEEYPWNPAALTGKLTPEEAHERFSDEAIAKQMPKPKAEEPPPEALPKPVWVEEPLTDEPTAPQKPDSDEPPKPS